MAILAGVGPMGLGAIDYALHCDRRPSMLVVTDIDTARLERAESIYPPEYAKSIGIEAHYVNTMGKTAQELMDITGGTGFDDVLVMAPVKPVVEMGDAILGQDGCMNFFAGPTNTQFKAEFASTSALCGNLTSAVTAAATQASSRGAYDDGDGKVNPSAMITHIGGLNCVPETTLGLHGDIGGKKLIYTQLEMPWPLMISQSWARAISSMQSLIGSLKMPTDYGAPRRKNTFLPTAKKA